MKLAIDFDGVLTDLCSIRTSCIDTHAFLRSPCSIEFSKPRVGSVEMISALSLFCDIVLVTSRPKSHESMILKWLCLWGFDSLISQIVCCGGAPKNIALGRDNAFILVDDSVENVQALLEPHFGILWSAQSWIELTTDIVESLIHRNSACIRGTGMRIVSLENISDLGASPVFVLTADDETRLKLRICVNRSVVQRIRDLGEIVNEAGYSCVAKTVQVSGLAVLKEFLPGKVIGVLEETRRHSAIEEAGRTLASLHDIPIDRFEHGRKPWVNGCESLVILAADDFNTIVKDAGGIAFVDLESATAASRWVDMIWAAMYLCRTRQEFDQLCSGYFSVFDGLPPSKNEIDDAADFFRHALHDQIQRSLMAHSHDDEKGRRLRTIDVAVWHAEFDYESWRFVNVGKVRTG